MGHDEGQEPLLLRLYSLGLHSIPQTEIYPKKVERNVRNELNEYPHKVEANLYRNIAHPENSSRVLVHCVRKNEIPSSNQQALKAE